MNGKETFEPNLVALPKAGDYNLYVVIIIGHLEICDIAKLLVM